MSAAAALGWRRDWGKTRASAMNHPLSGITVGGLARFLTRYRRHVDAAYAHRLAFLSLMAVLNSALALVETLWYGRKINAQELNPHVVFVLGQPRSGTTHVHNLLAQDASFAHATTFDVGFPSSFLWTQSFLPWFLQGLLSPTRPMDNMKLAWDLPQEDELAINQLSGGVSPYAAISLLRRDAWLHMLPLWTLRREDGCSAADFSTWHSAAMHFYRKLQLRAGPSKRLLLKSPVHTARVQVLSGMFPRAQFILVHRDPYTVFRSGLHMASTYYGYSALHEPSDDDVLTYVLEQGKRMHEAYMRDATGLLDRGCAETSRLVEVAFQQLDVAPMRTIAKIYAALRLAGGGTQDVPASVRSAVLAYLESLGAFRKNSFAELPPAARELVRSQWRKMAEDFGYHV